MGVEIERKFLVLNDSWREGIVSSHTFLDGLLAIFGGGKIRVRLAEDCAWITVKGPREGLSRTEFEYEVPRSDATAMLSLCAERTIKKTRHCVVENAQAWSVDVYDGLLRGLILAEIELEDESQAVLRPQWLGAEVTGDRRFRTTALIHASCAPLDFTTIPVGMRSRLEEGRGMTTPRLEPHDGAPA
jgi:adenylate cyclase